jgi:sugar phosphate isomerase/epimerase
VARAAAYLELATALDASALNVHCGAPILGERSGFREQARVQAAGLGRIARLAAARGLGLNVEAPHRNGLCRTLDESLLLLDTIGQPNAAFLLDVTHVHAGAARPEDAVRAFDGRLAHVHLRDGKGEDIFHVPGDGEIDFRAFFSSLVKANYPGVCALELEGHGETLDERRRGLRRALAFLTSQADEVSGLAGR